MIRRVEWNELTGNILFFVCFYIFRFSFHIPRWTQIFNDLTEEHFVFSKQSRMNIKLRLFTVRRMYEILLFFMEFNVCDLLLLPSFPMDMKWIIEKLRLGTAFQRFWTQLQSFDNAEITHWCQSIVKIKILIKFQFILFLFNSAYCFAQLFNEII